MNRSTKLKSLIALVAAFALVGQSGAIAGGKRGTTEFVAPQRGQISVIVLRAKSGGRLTAMPVLTK